MMDPADYDLAAEAALGVLEADERAAADRRATADPEFAREVERWSLRLGRIAADEAEERRPPEHVWRRLKARLAVSGEEAAEVTVLRARLRLWRALAVAASMAAIIVTGVAIRSRTASQPARPTAAMPETASLSATDEAATAFIAVFAPDRGELILTPVNLSSTRGKRPQLWVIPTGGKPVSLGLADFNHPVRLSVGDLVGGDVRRTLAVSLEPLGGSPTGLPTGPVIASGRLQNVKESDPASP